MYPGIGQSSLPPVYFKEVLLLMVPLEDLDDRSAETAPASASRSSSILAVSLLSFAISAFRAAICSLSFSAVALEDLSADRSFSTFFFFAFDGMKNLNRSALLSDLYPDRPIIRCLSGFGLGVWVGWILTLMLREFTDPGLFSAGRRIRWRDLLIALCLSIAGVYLLVNADPRWIPIQRAFGLTLGLVPVAATGALFFVLLSAMDRLIRFAREPLPVWDRVLGAAALTALFVGSMIVFRYQVAGGWIREISAFR